MQFNKINVSIFGLFAIVIILFCSSYNSGITGQSTNGCGGSGCHTMNSNTLISLSGIPAAGYYPGTTYSMTLTVSNANSSFNAAGFDLKTNGGIITQGTGSLTSGNNELIHTTKQSFTGGSTSWNFNWTAPVDAASNVTFFIAGNAVNSNSNQNGDGFNTVNFLFNPSVTALPPTISNVQISNITANSATITGKVNAHFSTNNINVVYGLTFMYGSISLATPDRAYADTNTNFIVQLTGLSSNTTYHYSVKVPYFDSPVSQGSSTSGDSVFTTLNTVSVPIIKENKIDIFPNPLNDKFEIISQNEIINYKIEMISMLGQHIKLDNVIRDKKSLSIFISDLSNGIYFAKININDKDYFRTLIKR